MISNIYENVSNSTYLASEKYLVVSKFIYITMPKNPNMFMAYYGIYVTSMMVVLYNSFIVIGIGLLFLLVAFCFLYT